MDLQFPGRTTTLDQLRPGACFLTASGEGPDLGLVVEQHGQRRVLILNRRHADGMHLPIVRPDPVDADVLQLLGPTLVPSRALADFAFGRLVGPGDPPALYLGDGSAYLCGCDATGKLATFDASSGTTSAIDLAYLPRSRRWRLMIPQAGGGLAAVYEAAPL